MLCVVVGDAASPTMRSCLLGATVVVVGVVVVVLAVPPTTAASPHSPHNALPNARQGKEVS